MWGSTGNVANIVVERRDTIYKDLELRDQICGAIFGGCHYWKGKTNDEEINRYLSTYSQNKYYDTSNDELKKQLKSGGSRGKDTLNILKDLKNRSIPCFDTIALPSEQDNLEYIEYRIVSPFILYTELGGIILKIRSKYPEIEDKFTNEIFRKCYGNEFDLYTAKAILKLFDDTGIVDDLRFVIYKIIKSHLKLKYKQSDVDIDRLLK